MLAGPPVDLSRWRVTGSGTDPYSQADADTLRAVTDAIMARIAEQLAEFRAEPPPAQVWDPATQAHVQRRSA